MKYIDRVLNEMRAKDTNQPEFIQALEEVLGSAEVIFKKHPEYEKMAVLERLVEPERIIQFKVPWVDDSGFTHVNRGYRVQYNSALGPYKGGLRFHPTVNLSVLKFLGFEQVFKNALTTLPIGGGKGGSDFNPKGKSDAEIMRFCQSFMLELYRHIGPDIDVPAGDMGVGGREIGYLYGQYRRIRGTSERGVFTGKGIGYGGSLARKEATGYGLVYFLLEMLKENKIDPVGKKAIVSGSGNVAIYAAEKAMSNGIHVIAMSDSQGYIVDDELDLKVVKKIKEELRGSLKDYPKLAKHGQYFEGSVYDAKLKVEIVLPCATQNEIDLKRAKAIVAGGCIAVAEGANMPDNNDAIKYYLEKDILFAPGKASNAGGVATSALEMSQNSLRYNWTFEEVDEKLQGIMVAIHQQCIDAMKQYRLGKKNYVAGANVAGMTKVIDAMIAQGDY
jgi:glutamate dehydrogenase (NADP+)